MRIVINKGLAKVALILSMMGGLAACGGGGGGGGELDEELERSSNFTFVNALNYSADFHLQRRNISTDFSGLFDSKHRVTADIKQNSVGETYTYSYKAINPMLNIGVRNSISLGDEEKLYKTLSDKDNYWLIAWDSAGDNKLALIDRAKNDQTGKMNVRIFADASYVISVNGSNAGSTKNGEATTFYSLDNCNTSLKLNDKAINLCSADYGSSYLLVADSNGMRLIATE